MMSSIYSSETQFTVDALAQQRGNRWLFQPMDFQLNPGEILYLQGANGAGKTSLLKVLTGLIAPSVGEVKWCGQLLHDCWHTFAKSRLFLGHQDGLRRGLTVMDNLQLAAYLVRGTAATTDQLAHCLDMIDLTAKATSHIDALSAGQRRRLGLGRLFMSQAQLWILDEPLTALDQAGIALFYAQLHQHIARNGMVVITSHQMLALPNLPVKSLSLQAIE